MKTMLALFIALFIALIAHAAAAAPLRLCYEDAPQAPWTMPNETGLNFELLKRVEKISGEQFEYHLRPWVRCMEETRQGKMDAMIGAADSPERSQFSVKPAHLEQAMYEDEVKVYLRAGSGASWDGKTLHNPSRVAVAQRGYFVADLLRAQGQRVLESIKSAEDGLRMLSAGTADVAVLLGRPAETMVSKDPRFAGKIVVAKQAFVSFPFYLMVSKKTYAADPKRIDAIWNAIASVRASADYRKLEAQAMRPPD